MKPHANAWLAVAPSVGKKTLIPSVNFVKLMRWSLGMPQNGNEAGEDVEAQMCPKGQARLDAKGHHLVYCKLNGFTLRHHVVADALASVTRAGNLPCQREMALPFEVKDNNGWPRPCGLQMFSSPGTMLWAQPPLT